MNLSGTLFVFLSLSLSGPAQAGITLGVQDVPVDGALQLESELDEATRAASLARSPSELPSASPGTWDRFFDPEGFEERLASLDPGAARALQGAEAAYGRGDFPLALTLLQRALVASPDLPPAWLVLGTTYFRMQRYSDARESFERLVAVAPGEAWRTQGLAHSYYSLGAFGAAKSHYELVLERVPKSSGARQGLALAHWRLGSETAALALIANLARDEPESFEAQLWYGRFLFDSGDTDGAIAQARLATRLAGHDPRTWFLLLECLWDLEQEEEALRVEFLWRERDTIAQERRRLRAELQLHPRDWARLRRSVDLARSVGDTQAVKQLLPRLLKSRPEDVGDLEMRLFALEVLEQLGDLKSARAVANGIERANSENPDAWHALEAFYGRTGDSLGVARAGERRRRLGVK